MANALHVMIRTPVKSKHNSAIRRYSLMTVVSLLPFFAMAQDPGPCPDCPIDNGLILLLAAGVGYGVKKYRDMKRGNEVRS